MGSFKVSSLRSRGDGPDRERGAKGDKDGARDGRNARGLAAVDLRPVPELLGAVPAPAAHAAVFKNGADVGAEHRELDRAERVREADVVQQGHRAGVPGGDKAVAPKLPVAAPAPARHAAG